MGGRISGRDVVSVLRQHGFEFVSRSGSHVTMRYRADDGEVRTVTIPMHDEIATGTLQNVADQCGANDFHAWTEWIRAHR